MPDVPGFEHRSDTISVREFMESQLEAMRAATTIAAEEMNRRLDTMNHLRAQLDRQATEFVTKDEYTSGHTRLAEDVRMLREAKARMEGKASQDSVVRATMIGVAGVVIGVLSLVLRFLGK